jgi:gas vesicle protein
MKLKRNNGMKKQRNLIIACLAAATAGVAIGMLLAPDKGENLRKTAKKTVGDWAGKLADLMKHSGVDGNGAADENSSDKEAVREL